MLPTLQAARTLFAAGEMIAAADMLAALDAAGAADAMALHLWGMTLSQLDRPEEAAVVLERAVAAEPSLSNAKADLAEICAKTGDDDRAITLLRAVNECVPGHTSGRRLAELLVAKALPLVEDARYAEALPLLQEAVQLNFTVPDALALLGITLSRVGSPWQAEQVLREALRLYPGHFGSMTNLASVLDILNRPQEAEALCRQVIGEHAPALAAAWCNLGAALRSQGRIGEAQAIFEKALAMEPAFSCDVAALVRSPPSETQGGCASICAPSRIEKYYLTLFQHIKNRRWSDFPPYRGAVILVIP